MEWLAAIGSIAGLAGAVFGWWQNRQRRKLERAVFERDLALAGVKGWKKREEIEGDVSKLSRDQLVARLRELDGQ